MEARVEDLRDTVAAGWTPGAEERASLLVRVDGIRRLCARQLAVEGW